LEIKNERERYSSAKLSKMDAEDEIQCQVEEVALKWHLLTRRKKIVCSRNVRTFHLVTSYFFLFKNFKILN
jgi:hypothetical protein